MRTICTLILGLFFLGAHAHAGDGLFMTTFPGPRKISNQWGTLEKKYGMVEFCAGGEPLCEVAEPTTVKFDEVNWALVKARNDCAFIKYKEDDGPAWPLFWPKNVVAEGDCKATAICYWRALLDADVPPGAISIAFADIPERRIAHATVVVTTDKGDFLVDLNHGITRWYEPEEYSWRLRTRPGNPMRIDLYGIPDS